MRSLKEDSEWTQSAPAGPPADAYASALAEMKRSYHGRCLFNCDLPVADMKMTFADNGDLHGSFRCDERYGGYDGMVHGGIVAAIVDAAMTQCLMGHGIAGYTGELSVRYRKPVLLNKETRIAARVVNDRFEKLYTMQTAVLQDEKTCVTASAKFLKIS
jgi:acyl-coenzyme A thioesterase PaaI-like protein